MTDSDDAAEAERREAEWAKTPIGAAFAKFERAAISYGTRSVLFSEDNPRIKETYCRMEQARREFLKLMRGW